ncbi:MAG: hypothetical protein OXB88_00695 [Bacteriovoracales bacterium]|nr:hypothetical protein [Bacteriovoracales bacterium]
MNKIWAYLKDDDGQTSTEYILLVAVAALIVFKFKDVAEDKLTGLTNTIFGKAESGIANELDQAIN